MKRNLVWILGAGAMLAPISGCFISAAKVMDSWVGAPEPDLVGKWGAPNRVYRLENGNRVLTYVESVRCERSFTVANGRVASWSSTPDCPKDMRK